MTYFAMYLRSGYRVDGDTDLGLDGILLMAEDYGDIERVDILTENGETITIFIK